MLLRQQFFAFAADVDRTWHHESAWGNRRYETEFPGYSVLQKYLTSVTYIGGQPEVLPWVDITEGGGAYDPDSTVETLKQTLDRKLLDYSTAKKQAHLSRHSLTEVSLLVHGGFNVYAYNFPRGRLTMEDISVVLPTKTGQPA